MKLFKYFFLVGIIFVTFGLYIKITHTFFPYIDYLVITGFILITVSVVALIYSLFTINRNIGLAFIAIISTILLMSCEKIEINNQDSVEEKKLHELEIKYNLKPIKRSDEDIKNKPSDFSSLKEFEAFLKKVNEDGPLVNNKIRIDSLYLDNSLKSTNASEEVYLGGFGQGPWHYEIYFENLRELSYPSRVFLSVNWQNGIILNLNIEPQGITLGTHKFIRMRELVYGRNYLECKGKYIHTVSYGVVTYPFFYDYDFLLTNPPYDGVVSRATLTYTPTSGPQG